MVGAFMSTFTVCALFAAARELGLHALSLATLSFAFSVSVSRCVPLVEKSVIGSDHEYVDPSTLAAARMWPLSVSFASARLTSDPVSVMVADTDAGVPGFAVGEYDARVVV